MKMLSGYYDFILELHSDNVENVRLKWYADMDEKEFEEIISADPTTIIKNDEIKKMGNYSKWLLHLYKTGNLLLEDLYKATEYLTLHKNNYSTLSRINKKLLNLFNFKTLPELYDAIAAFDKPKDVVDEKVLITNRFYINSNQAKIVFENDKYLVINPLTIEAENFYGVNSKWCTLKPGMWKSYTDKGPLYIFINKKKLNSKDPKKRLQLHNIPPQYMDMDDRPVEYYITLSELKDKPEMKPIIDELSKNANYVILSGREVSNIYLNGTKEEIEKIIERYNWFDDSSDDEYSKILDRLSNLRTNHIETIIMNNRVIDNDSYISLFAKLPTNKQLELCFINNDKLEILKPQLNDAAKEVLLRIESILTNEVILKQDIIDYLGALNNLTNEEQKYEYAMTKSHKWRIAMLLYILDNFLDIITIKKFLLRFEEDLRFIKYLNKPGNEHSKFYQNILLNLTSDIVTESVKQDNINKIKRRQIRLEILLGE